MYKISRFLLLDVLRLGEARFRFSTVPEPTKNLLIEIESHFERIKNANRKKEIVLEIIGLFRETRARRIDGQVEFIEKMAKKLKSFDLHKDLDIYKALLLVFPEDILIPKNYFQSKFMHYPVQQYCAIDLLDTMEWYGVYPDKEIHDIMVDRFGEYNFATQKAKRMLYWLPKLRHTNKYLDKRKVEHQNLTEVELAKLALRMICRDSGTKICFLASQSDGSWIVSGQSPLQRMIINRLEAGISCYVDGPSFVYVMENKIKYVLLTSAPTNSADEEWVDQRTTHDFTGLHAKLFNPVKPDDEPNLHQQSDMTILALAVLQQNSHQCASSWIS